MNPLEALFEQICQRVAQIIQEGGGSEAPAADGAPKRTRRTKAQIEADKLAEQQGVPATVATAPTAPIPAPAPFVPQPATAPMMPGFGIPAPAAPVATAPTAPISTGFGFPAATPAPAPVAQPEVSASSIPPTLVSVKRLSAWMETANPQDKLNRQQWVAGCQNTLQTTPGADLPAFLANCNDAQAHEWVERIMRLDTLLPMLVKYTQPRVEAAAAQVFGARHFVLIPSPEWSAKFAAFEQACVA